MIPNLDIDQTQLAAFCQRWRIVELSVFGSVLRDDFNKDSDVDFLVMFSPDATTTLFDLVDMESEMTGIVGRPVDIIGKKAVERSRNPVRRKAILNSYEVVYAA